MKKYELTDIRNNNLYRIRALRDIPRHNVKIGDLGGWVETEGNLSQCGDCWIGGDAAVAERSMVCVNALVEDDAKIEGNVLVGDNATVREWAWIYGHVWVGGNAIIKGDVCVNGNARISKSAVIETKRDYITIGPIGQYREDITFYRTKAGIWMCGETYEGLVGALNMPSNCQPAQAYLAAIELAKIQIEC